MLRLLLYCTKNKNQLFYDVISQKYMYGKDSKNDKFNSINGKIVAECDFECEEIRLIETPEYAGSECNTFLYDLTLNFETETLTEDELCKQSCLNASELNKYLDLYKERDIYGYAIHIKNLNIFDKPREVNEYWKNGERVKNAPKNMMLVQNIYEDKIVISLKEVKGIKVERKVLISVSPEEMCRICNGEQDILVRKNVLKEML